MEHFRIAVAQAELDDLRASRRGPPPGARIPVPIGHARFPGDTFRTPRRWAGHRYGARRWTGLPRGGHSPALEGPDLLLAELRASFAECDPRVSERAVRARRPRARETTAPSAPSPDRHR